jgi:8-oxo-dGTP diphosphatase
MSISKTIQSDDVIQAAGGLLWRKGKRGPQIAVVHRPRYDDWSLPKGLLKEGESWQQAALREVGEETGCQALLGDFLGCNCYMVEGQPKVVLFWQMALREEEVYDRHEEVDRLVWLSPKKALKRLSYKNEKALLKEALSK